MSIGSFIGPIAAGQLRDFVSPYFIAFALLMLGLMMIPTSRKPGSLLYPNAKQTAKLHERSSHMGKNLNQGEWAIAQNLCLIPT